MRTAPANAARPKKSALRINKQESLAAVPVPRGLAEPPVSQMDNRPLSAEDLRQLSISEALQRLVPESGAALRSWHAAHLAPGALPLGLGLPRRRW